MDGARAALRAGGTAPESQGSTSPHSVKQTSHAPGQLAVQKPRARVAGHALPPLFKRKRSLGSSEYTNSSDPPLFSSDDLQPDAADYGTKRQKRLYPGTWWSNPLRHPPQDPDLPHSKRALERNFDSGVFMGSESSGIRSDDLADLLHHSGSASQSAGAEASHGKWSENPATAGPALPAAQCKWLGARPALSEDEALARRYVQECVEWETTLVDISSYNLPTIQNETLRPLRYLMRAGKNVGLMGVENYEPFLPEVRLFLSRNGLVELPGELFNLTNVVSLSVRSNQLTEIPPQLARLDKLQDLNVTMNQLRHLPFAFLKLVTNSLQRTETFEEFMTAQFRLRPNPFLEPVSFASDSGAESSPSKPPHDLQVRAISAVAYFSVYGRPERHDQPTPSGTVDCVRPPPTQETPAHRSGVPSLLELCLRSACASNRLPTMIGDIEALKPYGVISPSIVRGLEQAAKAREAGALLCDVCDKEYVVARAEWLEWWAGVRDNEDDLIPLLRRTCSWGCAAAADRDADGLQEEWRGCGWKQPA